MDSEYEPKKLTINLKRNFKAFLKTLKPSDYKQLLERKSEDVTTFRFDSQAYRSKRKYVIPES